MKKAFFKLVTLVTICATSTVFAQVGVGVPAGDIHPSAELEVKSSTKGFLPPRMTKAQRLAMIVQGSTTFPAAGLLVFQTDGDANEPTGLYFFDGTAWRNGAGVVGAKGDNGVQGDVGPKGDKGDTGAQGVQGAQGQNTLAKTTTEAAGANCITGGVKIEYGFDANNSGTLDDAEINPALTKYVCNGIQGPIGEKGLKGDVGPKGDQGPAGTGISSGTSKNQLMYWNGSAWVTLNPGTNGQVLTVSDGDLIWTLIDGDDKPITDIDGNTYKTVTIGTQTWMAENLKVSKYSDGTAIPNITDYTQWSQLSTGAWSYYNNDVANNAKYGKLYNWYAVSPDNKNVCPKGWHVPKDAEWTVLTEYLGGASIAGGKLKEVGTTSWKSPNTEATNTSLFSALPGGYRNGSGNYFLIGDVGDWWSSSEGLTGLAWGRFLLNDSGGASRDYDNKGSGFSVRCLRD